MKFTAQEEYGLRCLLAIAQSPGACATIPDVAERESLSEAYVAKLLRVLRQGGLLESTRGQKGGYRLAHPAAEISLATALTALRARLCPRDSSPNHAATAAVSVHAGDCSIRSLWSVLDDMVQRALLDTRLSALL